MSSRRNSLAPPEQTNLEDPGAHELESEPDDHFSDAQSNADESSASPIPRTRVEKVSDEPSYGEVPGTEPYLLREGDAKPDEISVIAENKDEASESADSVANAQIADPPSNPGGQPIPTTILEESANSNGRQTPDEKKHEADPLPDLIVKADGTLEDGSADTTALTSHPDSIHFSQESAIAETAAVSSTAEDLGEKEVEAGEEETSDDDFGDDFDEFEEGGGDDDDFGDFDDGFEEPPPVAAAAPQSQPSTQPALAVPPPLSFPVPDFEGLDAEDILKTAAPYLNGLYQPDDSLPDPPQLNNSIFLTPRSASLWSQLVAPPPLQPPDWIRSRIRRLFLVSLGVPVDLDEILPASKQKKLILPSLTVRRSDSPRTSSDSRSNTGGGAASKDGASSAAANNSVARLKQSGTNGSNSSLDSQGKPAPSSRKRKGPPPPPDLDVVAGQQLCKTTDEALDGMTDDELWAHAKKLAAVEVAAKETLEYWTKRTDEKIGDREAFEGVIESLVAHARKTRK
ncbi:hypothetical protein SEPCBS57363_000736 [Sporothrix epigloea]|uniref:Uncharacterized protein n=1 Tax=Sporothrix epigloea TaxID=1892477 RepID=A0ABP0D6C6_9PEZI